MSQWVAGSRHCDARGWEQSKGCRAQSVCQCGLARCRESRDSPSAHRRCATCPVGSGSPPTPGSKVRAKDPCAQLPAAGQRGAGGLPAAERERRGSPAAAGHSTSAPRQGAQPGLWLPAATVGPAVPRPPAPPPALPLSRHGKQRARPWGQPSGKAGPARCSLLLAFALSSAACVLCRRADVNPDICGRTFAESDLCVHEFCLVSSSPQGLLPASCQGCSLPSFAS